MAFKTQGFAARTKIIKYSAALAGPYVGFRADNDFAARVVEIIRSGAESGAGFSFLLRFNSPIGQGIELNGPHIDPRGNKLLATLSREAFETLSPHFVFGAFVQGVVLAESGEEIESVYFPLSGMISIVVVMKDGKAIETATVGRDGVFGAMVGFGPYVSKVRAIVQMPITAVRIPSLQFRKAAQASRELQSLCIDYNEFLLVQARISAACNALHKVEARFCRWLLQTRETTGSDTITLTQEFLSEMLGVRRTSVTDVASKLQSAGVISYSRGVIKIIDLLALKSLSCECYETLLEQRAI